MQRSTPQGNLALVHTRLSLRTQNSLSVKAEVLYWQQRPVLAELEECDKVLGATVLGASSYYQSWQSITDELPASNIHAQAAFAEKALVHISAKICMAAVYRAFQWEVKVEISGGKQSRCWQEEEEKKDMKGDERRSWEGWEHGQCLRAAPISLLESDQSTGMNTQTHTFTQTVPVQQL